MCLCGKPYHYRIVKTLLRRKSSGNFGSMNARTIICIAPVLMTLASCGQSKNVVRKTYAFYTEHLPGTIMKDDEGRPVNPPRDTIYTVYVETGTTDIKWLEAWTNGQSFSIIATPMAGNQEVGTTKWSDKKIIVKPSAGNKLWLLQLQKAEVSSKAPAAMKSGEIILRGRTGKKTFTQKISPPVELAGIPSV